MNEDSPEWRAEIDRRAAIYDGLERQGAWPGRMSLADYTGVAALTVLLFAAFWMWAA